MSKLKAIVSVDFKDRVRCGEPGCGHSVYKAIHVVQDGSELLVLGSTCFARRFGSSEALGDAIYGGGVGVGVGVGVGRQLTDAERALLTSNTAALLAQFEAEAQEEVRLRQAVLSRQVLQPPKPIRSPIQHQHIRPTSSVPWPWMKPLTSMMYFHLKDGTGWIRVQHKDGEHRLMPWPKFEGWDETLPASIGTADLEIGGLHVKDIAVAVQYLRDHGEWEKLSGSWRELVNEVSKRTKAGNLGLGR